MYAVHSKTGGGGGGGGNKKCFEGIFPNRSKSSLGVLRSRVGQVDSFPLCMRYVTLPVSHVAERVGRLLSNAAPVGVMQTLSLVYISTPL